MYIRSDGFSPPLEAGPDQPLFPRGIFFRERTIPIQLGHHDVVARRGWLACARCA